MAALGKKASVPLGEDLSVDRTGLLDNTRSKMAATGLFSLLVATSRRLASKTKIKFTR